MLSNIYLRECLLYITLIKEACSLRGKASIVLHMLAAPWRCFLRMIGRKYDRPLIRDVTMRNIDGLFYCGRSFTSCRAVSSFYEKDLDRFFSLNEGVFVDVGAHIGKYTIRLANRLGNRGEVIAIEPEEHNFGILEKNVSLNRLKNIHLVNVACSDRDGKTAFYVLDNYTTLHSVYKSAGRTEVVVKASKLDTLLSKLNVNRVDLIKIDVEGAEMDAIKGSRDTLQKYHPRVLFETWDEEHLQEMKRFLKNFNYKIRQINDENYLAY